MEYRIEELVKVAKRENNSKRPYLYVNPLQGKHIPVDPADMINVCRELAGRIAEAYPEEKLLIIGFAETATAIAAAVAMELDNAIYFQCTTRENDSQAEYAYFTESHSHATEQKLDIKNYSDIMREIERIVFVEDEVTTGDTICKLIHILRDIQTDQSVGYAIASILNSMTLEREQVLAGEGIGCLCVNKLLPEYHVHQILDLERDDSLIHCISGNEMPAYIDICSGYMDQRKICLTERYREQVNEFARRICRDLRDKEGGRADGRALVLGTEEFMYPAVCLGECMKAQKLCDNVVTHSTTRSPILPSGMQGYPLSVRYQMQSVYEEGRETYLYNLTAYDIVIVVTDSEDAVFSDLYEILRQTGNDSVYFYRWRQQDGVI